MLYQSVVFPKSRLDLTIWHINADDPRVLDCNEEYKSVGQVTSLYIDNPYRSSDHDPVIVGLELRGELPHRGYLPLVRRS
jgi:predicted extracellular nuclease